MIPSKATSSVVLRGTRPSQRPAGEYGSGAPFASGTSLGTLALNGRGLSDDVIDAAVLATRAAVYPRWDLEVEPGLWF